MLRLDERKSHLLQEVQLRRSPHRLEDDRHVARHAPNAVEHHDLEKHKETRHDSGRWSENDWLVPVFENLVVLEKYDSNNGFSFLYRAQDHRTRVLYIHIFGKTGGRAGVRTTLRSQHAPWRPPRIRRRPLTHGDKHPSRGFPLKNSTPPASTGCRSGLRRLHRPR